jgi:mannose-1-phosphate guanylyltransferase
VAAGLATVLARRESDEVALVLPADHFVADEEAFGEALGEAARAAERGYLVTLGVTPTSPATGYGYIKAGAALHPSAPTALVERFVEKPDAATAARYLEEGGYSWNAGIFAWRVYAFRQALERFQPELAGALARIEALHRTPGWMSEVRAVLEPIGAVTIDVGIAEPAAAEGRMAVVPLDAGWSDIGSWSALLEALSTAEGKDLVASGRHLDRGSHRVLVHGGDRLVVTVGLEDVIIVDTPDALLVCARDRAEEIKPVLDEIARTAGDRYL